MGMPTPSPRMDLPLVDRLSGTFKRKRISRSSGRMKIAPSDAGDVPATGPTAMRMKWMWMAMISFNSNDYDWLFPFAFTDYPAFCVIYVLYLPILPMYFF